MQWLTAGEGIVHSEMFPLLDRDGPNPCELFQIWLNLPAADKMVDPYFTMFWDEDIPRQRFARRARPRDRDHRDRRAARGPRAAGAAAELVGVASPRPTSRSGMSSSEPRRAVTLPPARGADTVRTLYVFEGRCASATTTSKRRPAPCSRCDEPVVVTGGPYGAEALVLQGRPIGEPVAQYGPFVMNDEAGIEQAFADYRRTGFGGWPWPTDDPVHPRDAGPLRPPRRRSRRGCRQREHAAEGVAPVGADAP